MSGRHLVFSTPRDEAAHRQLVLSCGLDALADLVRASGELRLDGQSRDDLASLIEVCAQEAQAICALQDRAPIEATDPPPVPRASSRASQRAKKGDRP